jgi:hypothetical protein
MGRLLKPTSLNRYLSADGDSENLWDPKGSQVAIEYDATAKFGIAIVTAATGALLTKQLANNAFISVDSWPVPPMGDKKDPCLQGVLAAAAEWRAETNPVLKFGKWIKMEALALICAGGTG